MVRVGRADFGFSRLSPIGFLIPPDFLIGSDKRGRLNLDLNAKAICQAHGARGQRGSTKFEIIRNALRLYGHVAGAPWRATNFDRGR